MPETSYCVQCGDALAASAIDTSCPACLLESGILSGKAELPSRPEQRIGRYELVEEIARGGMGVVHKAWDTELDRLVALKMILAGQLASAGDVDRFRAEARAAAGLKHPNIVAIHEVGESEGRHFFAMDFVEGQTLRQLIRDSPLPAHRAAGYLKTIAEAVQYAHEHGIVHRDLKPSNVLIDVADQPHVTDFGLAKRIDSKADLTLSGAAMGTPGYMPPEQASGQSKTVGPTADVYALGAMLYDLLTGRPPFRAETPLETMAQAVSKEPVAPRLLNASVPPDIETICLKCLEKEPSRRYGTAKELALELGRFLNDEPIHARPVSSGEKFWRWCRRHRALAATGGVALVLLLAVAIGSPIAMFRIKAGRTRAEAEAEKSAQVSRFLKEMLKGVGPYVAKGRDTTLLREILDRTAARVSRDLTNQPSVRAELQLTLAESYRELGRYDLMETMARENLRLNRPLLGDRNPAVAQALSQLSLGRMNAGDLPNAEKLGREALALLEASGNKEKAGDLRNILALVLYNGKKFEEAESMFRQVLSAARQRHGNNHQNVALTLNNLALTLRSQKRLPEAEAAHREALAIQERLAGGRVHPDVALSLSNLGLTLADQRNWVDADAAFEESLSIWRQLLDADHKDIGIGLRNLADSYRSQRRFPEAETKYREALAIFRKRPGSNPREIANLLPNLAFVVSEQGRTLEEESFASGTTNRSVPKSTSPVPAPANAASAKSVNVPEAGNPQGQPPQPRSLKLEFFDPSGDAPRGVPDLTNVVFRFDTTGHYSVTLTTTSSQPFSGDFRINFILYDVDRGKDCAASFLTDTMRNLHLAVPTNTIVLTGSQPMLEHWRIGDRVAVNSGPFGNPNCTRGFRMGVSRPALPNFPEDQLGASAPSDFSVIRADETPPR